MKHGKKWPKKVINKQLLREFVEQAMVEYYLSGPTDNIRDVFDKNRDLQKMRDEILIRMGSHN